MKKIIIFIFIIVSIQNSKAQNLDSIQSKEPDFYNLGLIKLDTPIIVYYIKSKYKFYECSAVIIEKKNLNKIISNKRKFEYNILYTSCYTILFSPYFVYSSLLPICTTEQDSILKKIYHHSVVSKDERIICNEVYKYKSLRYKYFKDNIFLLVKMKVSIFNKHQRRRSDMCEFFFNDETKKNKYIMVLIPIIEGNSESKLRY